MSKTALKKALSQLDKEQVTNLVIELYQAKKEAKDYLDFFVNPDIDKRLDKAKANISKSIIRVKRGILKPRLTAVKEAIKSISTLSPGEEYVGEIMVYTVEQFCVGGMFGRMQDATLRSVLRHVKETVRYAERNGISNIVLPRIAKAIDNLKSDYMYRREYKRLMKETFEEAIEECAKELR